MEGASLRYMDFQVEHMMGHAVPKVLALEEGEFDLWDVVGEHVAARQRFAVRGVVIGGRWWHG